MDRPFGGHLEANPTPSRLIDAIARLVELKAERGIGPKGDFQNRFLEFEVDIVGPGIGEEGERQSPRAIAEE